MEQWNSEAMESRARRRNGGTVLPLAVARRGSWHPDFRHNTAQKERTIWAWLQYVARYRSRLAQACCFQ